MKNEFDFASKFVNQLEFIYHKVSNRKIKPSIDNVVDKKALLTE